VVGHVAGRPLAGRSERCEAGWQVEGDRHAAAIVRDVERKDVEGALGPTRRIARRLARLAMHW
jgi:hypothetical protein